MAEYTTASDDEFAAFAKRAQQEAEEQAKRNSNGFFNKEFDQLKYVGLEENIPKILRLVGRPPESIGSGKCGATDAHEIFISMVLDDEGKKMELRLPLHSAEKENDHIMYRIYNLVSQVDWVKNPATGKTDKKYKYEGKPWFEKIVHGGYDPINDSINYKNSKGWRGQQVLIMNVIDREDNWCAENKHTKLLSKKINISKDGTKEFPFKGVPSYGFANKLSQLVSGNGSWEKYDIAICRTGSKESPIRIWDTPVSALKKAGILPMDLKAKENCISIEDHLTQDELDYERYDLNHYFAPTTYQKIMKCFGNTIKAVDAELNRNFYEELQGLAQKEKEYFDSIYNKENGEENGNGTDAPVDTTSYVDDPYSAPVTVPEPTVTPTPMQETTATSTTPTRVINRAPATPSTGNLTPEKIALLKGWNQLTDYEKGLILDVELNADGTLKKVVYSPDAKACVLCEEAEGGCGFDSPSDFTACPVCGVSFLSN